MSSERLKKTALRLALGLKIINILILIGIILQTVSLLWLTVFPNKLVRFFEMVRIYEPFVSDIGSAKTSLFELSSGVVTYLFLFVIVKKLKDVFHSLSISLHLSEVAQDVKRIAICFLLEAMSVPLLKIIFYSSFMRGDMPSGVLDLNAVFLSGFLWLIAQIIQTKSVEKD